MRKLLLISGVAALVAPGVASAQPGCYEQKHDSRVAGTIIGAGLGALIGGSVAGHGSKTAGALVGAVGGGTVGNIAGGASVNCDNRTGYYDRNGVWHEASGYYDRDGRWIPAAPAAGAYERDVAYVGPANDLDGRENWLERRIQAGDASGALGRDDADRAFHKLADIRRHELHLRYDHGGLTADDRADVANMLDQLTDRVNDEWGF